LDGDKPLAIRDYPEKSWASGPEKLRPERFPPGPTQLSIFVEREGLRTESLKAQRKEKQREPLSSCDACDDALPSVSTGSRSRSGLESGPRQKRWIER
jgi:hypothetical protein